jgi:hypothetical protein
MEQIYTAIQAAANQDANEFRDAIGAALATKIQDALELKRIEIASTMFSSNEEPAEQEIVSDEDVQATA